jgi:hypothetical protein
VGVHAGFVVGIGRGNIGIMSAYPDAMSLREARRLFFKRSNLGEDGGYSRRWVRVESKPIPFYFPNWKARVAAARLHDLHHIAADYATDWPGEVEISAWEIASGCARYHAAWLLDIGGFNAGLVFAPRRLFRAFVRGRHTPTNLYKEGFADAQLDHVTVGMLRDRLDLKKPTPKANATDITLFVFWCVVVILVCDVPPLLGLAFLWLIGRKLF